MLKQYAPRWIAAALAISLTSACAQYASSGDISPEPRQYAPLTLSIAHINDTHSAFDPVDGHFYADDLQVFNQWGGHPRLLTRIEQHRQAAADHQRPFLVLHGGDAWQGTAYFKINEGRMNADILSRMGIDAMALGNHEFDLNNALLNEFIGELNFPLLAANIDTSEDADLHQQDNLKPYTLFAFDGATKRPVHRDQIASLQDAGQHVVAIFGIALDDMPNIAPNTGDVRFFDMVESAQQTVDTLQQLGVAHILAVTHIGNAQDVRIAQRVNGIDAIIGGHSHTLLGDFSNLGLSQSDRPYAEKVRNPDGASYTCVVQAGEYAQAVGLLEISFDSQGQVSDCGGGNTLLSNDDFYATRQRDANLDSAQSEQVLTFIGDNNNIAVVDEDTALRSHIDVTYKDAMQAAYGDAIAQVPAQIPHVRRPGDSNSDQHGSKLAPLIATAQFAWANQPSVQAISGLKPDFALVGAGGIRTALEEGELREGHITLETLPFASQLAIVPLRGSVVRELISQTVNATLPQGAHAGRFPYGGQLRYTFAETEAGLRGEVTELEVNHGDIDNPRWRALEDNVLYNVVMNSYIATGNDGWSAIAEAQAEHSDRVDLVYQDGHLRAYAVLRITTDDSGSLHAQYENSAPDCAADTVACNTDAQSVVHFFRQRSAADSGELRALDYPTVTLLREP
ncbi:MAG: bifunctional metallophosphatase/5'-nucleotidase [Idiomarina sp.]|nr:bifunctional metallophosphatase/5'-nucleotidase [Idiomarina sp.]